MGFQALDSADDVLAAAARHGLALMAPDAELDPIGLDFIVVHARDADGVWWVARSPRREDVVAAARREAAVLAVVRPRLPVAVPDWRIHADELIAYPRLAGIPAVTLSGGTPTWNRLDPAAPSEVFLDGMADLLVALAAATPWAQAAGVRVLTTAEEHRELARALDLAADLLTPSRAVMDRWQRWIDDLDAWPVRRALTHGDLHPGHLLLDEGGRLTGVLDWTEAQVGDPTVDLAMMHRCFGRAILDDLAARCTRRDGGDWAALIPHAIERSAAFPAIAAAWAARTGTTSMLSYLREQLADSEP